MNHNNNDDLSLQEKQQLKSLAREKRPSAELEERIVHSLREQRLIGSRPHVTYSTRIAAVVAAMVLVLGGFLIGKLTIKPAQPSGPMFLLLLYDAGMTSRDAESDRVVEYSQWIRNIRKSGRHAGGEKLKEDGRMIQMTAGKLQVRNGPMSKEEHLVLGGYFLIEAKDYQEAIRVAAGCPHLKYGGFIEIRQIDSI